MKYRILHRNRGRLRVHMEQPQMTMVEADILEYYLGTVDGVTDVKVNERTSNAIIRFVSEETVILSALRNFNYKESSELVSDSTGREMNRIFEEKLIFMVMRRYLGKLFVPLPLRIIGIGYKAFGYVREGLESLSRGKLEVSVLDATAIFVSLLRRDFATASSVMFLLNLGSILEEWTHKKSVDDLARTMSLNIDRVWQRVDGREISVPIDHVSVGDEVVVRAGGMIPLDGKVLEGEMTVNQSSITGESLAVHKECGGYVYAGTVVEEGECVLRVEKVTGNGCYDRIVRMIEESERLKSEVEDKASHLADRLVPYSFGGTVLTWLLTRNATRAISILMVDFSCALKLAMPIAVLSAMREGRYHHIAVKGGRFLEAVAEADTIVFDKTGTLTHACPRVADLIAFDGNDPTEMLRLAACLEEHYPHSIANAVVAEAVKRDLQHEEKHSKVTYVVAHGISSSVDGEKVVIGSRHFIFDDEKCTIPAGEEEKFAALPSAYSHLYMAIGGVLAAVICIEDPVREEASAVINSLYRLGIRRVVMMTGDNRETAAAVAAAVGVDDYRAEVLPEDKAAFIREEHAAGRKVIMVGDGINDSPALTEAHAGIAIGSGAAIAREVADITLTSEDLFSLVTLRLLAASLMDRINGNYHFIMGFNASLIGLGALGILPPAVSAFLHNASTLAVSLKSMTNLLD